MIKDSKAKKTITYKNLYGGKGLVHISHRISELEQSVGLDVFAEVIVETGASIGYHIHKTDSEAYYILAGEAIFIDNGKIEKPVQQGDLCIITKNQGHGIINTGRNELKILAIVWS